ncbi:hypothetical protein LTR86_005747 [Recurvomyces mirabilis]|nr:hypothetical protein LTR86_005747 [Recurvomyces mirabilis]
MGATRLPLELQQQIFTYLDTKSFFAARSVCKWWRFASLDYVTLVKQLGRLPILLPKKAEEIGPDELYRIWSEAAYTLMLGVNVKRLPDGEGSMTGPRRGGLVAGPRVSHVTSGDHTVTINDRTIALFNTSAKQLRVLAQRPLNDLKETVGSGPWLKMSPTAYHELALSSDGRLLAVAQERTIQIYDLLAEADSFTVNEYISSAAGHYICGLDFEQENSVLRVRLSGKGVVLYLGTPGTFSSQGESPLQYWKSKAGLRHMYLDSALISNSAGSTADQTWRLAGVQLLRPFDDGYLFAAQKHGGNESSHYVLGHVRHSTPHKVAALMVEPKNVTFLARMESFLSAWDYTLNGKNESGMGMWENMPGAHEHHPTFALSPDSTMIALAERDKKAVRPTPLTQLFLYRLPSAQRLLSTLHAQRAGNIEKWPTSSSFLDRIEGQRERVHEDVEMPDVDKQAKPKCSVARLPLCLNTIRGIMSEMKFAQHADGGLRLSALSTEAMKSWSLLARLFDIGNFGDYSAKEYYDDKER